MENAFITSHLYLQAACDSSIGGVYPGEGYRYRSVTPLLMPRSTGLIVLRTETI